MTPPLTDAELAAIRERWEHRHGRLSEQFKANIGADVPRLLAEVERLREALAARVLVWPAVIVEE